MIGAAGNQVFARTIVTTSRRVFRPAPATFPNQQVVKIAPRWHRRLIRAVEQSARDPVQRLIVVLAGVHAARTGAIRNLMVDDVDLPNRRITIAGHIQRLGELS